jgi:rSAM/selenodomain-associated transferase 2
MGKVMQHGAGLNDEPPVCSIILPVLNESARINGLINRLHEQEPGDRIEIIVVDGDAKGSTITGIVSDRVQKIISNCGRACQMNSGAAIAKGDILVFLHADTSLPEDAFTLISQSMRDRQFVGGAFDLGYETNQRIFKITEKYVYLRTRLTRIPFGDQAIFIRREYFRDIGGYRAVPLMEDVDLMKRIRRRGDHIVIIPEKVLTSTRRYEKEGILYCTLRNWVLQILYAFGVPPERLAKWYKS